MHIHKLRAHTGRSSIIVETGMGFQYVAAVAGAADAMGGMPSLAQTSFTALTTTSISSPAFPTSPSLLSTTLPVETATSSAISSSSDTSAPTALATSSNTRISVPIAAATAFSSPTPPLSPSPALSTRSPPFYIGVVLAAILLVAFGAAIVAWCLRSRRSAKQGFWKHDFEDWTPTVPPSDPEKTNIWEPTGDRDAGEPKRGLNEETGTVPPFLRESVAYPLPVIALPYAYAPPTPLPMSPYAVPPQMTTESFPSNQSSNIGSLQCSLDMSSMTGRTPYTSQSALIPSDFGTPRTTQDRPRFLGLSSGKGLAVPWRMKEGSSTNRAHDGEFVNMEEQHRYLTPPPLPSPHQQSLEVPEATTSGWTNSLRANIMGALSGLKSPAQIFLPSQVPDRLTPEPTTRRSKRRTKVIDGAEWTSRAEGDLGGEPESRIPTVVGDVQADVKRMDSLEDDMGVHVGFDSEVTTPGLEEKESGVERKSSVVSVYTAEEEVARKALAERRSKILSKNTVEII